MVVFMLLFIGLIIWGVKAIFSGESGAVYDRGTRKFINRHNAAQGVKKKQLLIRLAAFQEGFNTFFKKAEIDLTPRYLFIDFETTDLPVDYIMPSEDNLLRYPHAVQAAALVTNQSGELIDQYSSIICVQENAYFSPSATNIHGITKEKCMSEGKPISDFLSFLSKYDNPNLILIAHNIQFDHFILKIEAKRNKVKLPKYNTFCTMKGSKEMVAIYKESGKAFKNPNLKELVCHAFFEGVIVDIGLKQHDALIDVKLCALSFFKLALHEKCIPALAGKD